MISLILSAIGLLVIQCQRRLSTDALKFLGRFFWWIGWAPLADRLLDYLFEYTYSNFDET